ncbi:MAG: flagellar hook-length control protein FliK [Candidatus Scalindua sp.]|nr:flagellar hook-length control protein FliK [Candidatus Scalindua sp.]
MIEQSFNMLFGISSTQDTSVTNGLSNMNNTVQTKTGDKSFRPVLADSLEDMAAAANQALNYAGQKQNISPMNGESKLFLEKIVKSDLLIMDIGQGVPVSGLPDATNKETLLESEITPVPMGEDRLLYYLLGDSQGSNREIAFPGNLIEIAKTLTAEEPVQNQSAKEQNMNLAHAELNTVQGAKTGATNQIPIVELSSEIMSVQIKGEGVVSDSNSVVNTISDGMSTSGSKDKDSYIGSHPKPSFLFPENLKEMEADAGQFRFVQNGTDESENRINGLAANVLEDGETDESLQSAKLSQAQSLERDATLFPGERVNGNVNELSATQHVNQTFPANSDTKRSIGQGSRETERERGQNSPATKTGQSVSMASSAEGNIMNSVKSGEFVNRSTTEENTLLELQDTKRRVGSNGNITTIKLDLEPRLSSITTSGDINSANFSESLKTDVADQIVQGARLFLQGGKSEVKLQLNPPELGGLNLEFTIVDEVLEAKISVEKSLVKDIIEKDIPRLRELLSSENIDVGRFDVTLQEKEEERQGLMSKDLQPDNDSRERRNIAHGDKENVDEERDVEVLEQNTVNSDRINYLI